MDAGGGVPFDVSAGVAEHAARYGVPPDRLAAVARLDVTPGRAATGLFATTHGVRPVSLEAGADWPAGTLELIGSAEAISDPVDAPLGIRPVLAVEGVALVVYGSALTVPSGLAVAVVRWRSDGATVEIKLQPGRWRTADLEAAGKAARWLETLPQIGRPGERPEDVRREYLDAARAIVAKGDRLSVSALADKTARSVSRTKARMRQHGVTIGALKRALGAT